MNDKSEEEWFGSYRPRECLDSVMWFIADTRLSNPIFPPSPKSHGRRKSVSSALKPSPIADTLRRRPPLFCLGVSFLTFAFVREISVRRLSNAEGLSGQSRRSPKSKYRMNVIPQTIKKYPLGSGLAFGCRSTSFFGEKHAEGSSRPPR